MSGGGHASQRQPPDRYAAPWRTKGDAFPEIVAAGAAALVTGLYLGYVRPVDDGACFRQGVDAAQAATADGRVHPRTRAGGGARKIRVPLMRDEGDCGRGRSAGRRRRPNGVPPAAGCLTARSLGKGQKERATSCLSTF